MLRHQIVIFVGGFAKFVEHALLQTDFFRDLLLDIETKPTRNYLLQINCTIFF